MVSCWGIYTSALDKAQDAGSPSVRRALGETSLGKLRKMRGHRTQSPWEIRSIPRCLIQPWVGPYICTDRVPIASSLTADGEWKTYCYDEASGVWLECYPAEENQAVILSCALLNDREEHRSEVSALKVQVLNLQAKCNHLEQAYRRDCPGRLQPINWRLVAVVILVFVLTLIGGAKAEKVEYHTEFRHEFNEFLHWFWSSYYEVKAHFKNGIGGHRLDFIFDVLRWLSNYAWEFGSVALIVTILVQRKNVLFNLIYVTCAAVSGAKFAMLAIAPFQTVHTTFVTCLSSVLFSMEPVLTICLMLIYVCGFAVVGLFLPDVKYIQNLRGLFLSTVVFSASWVANILHLNTTVVTLCLAVWRIARLLQVPTANVLEVRDTAGRIAEKIPVNPNLLFNFGQRLKNFVQVRTKTVPLARVNPLALCHISCNEGKGTGFFCGNYIVTAGHVVGSEKSIRVCYNGRNYDAEVKRLLDKDVALCGIPSALNTVPRLKISKKRDCTWVCICAPSGDGAFLTAMTEGVEHGGTYSYATPTRDGMSGAPLLDADGHVLGVHQTNTGYTGGAVRLDLEDVIDPPKDDTKQKLCAEIEALKRELEGLRKKPQQTKAAPQKLEQCSMSEADIVNLVRAAMQREMTVLRDEIELGFVQAKGKTKKGRGTKHRLGRVFKKSKQRGPMFTEKEYQEMLDEGIDVDEIRRLAEEIYDETLGFPDWSDLDESDVDSIEEDWFGKFDTESDGYHQKNTQDLQYYLSKKWKGEDVRQLLQSLPPMDKAVTHPIMDKLQDATEDTKICVLLCAMDRALVGCGLAPASEVVTYEQRIPPKNVKKGGPRPPKQTSGHGKNN
ncbi:ORF1a [Gerbil astrovirus]|nr:ORF1a [Gerbil astrovirus]